MSTVNIPYDRAVRAIEVAAITLTSFNAVAAGLVVALVLMDNFRQSKSWLNIYWERRIPLYLGLCILFAQIVFITREFVEMGLTDSLSSKDSVAGASQNCIAMNQISWWGISASRQTLTVVIWLPLLALAMRVYLMAGAIIFKVSTSLSPYLTSSIIYSPR